MRRTAADIHDEWLVLRCQAGEAAAWRELASRWHGRLYRHARRLIDHPEPAEDIAQEAWMAVMRGLNRLDDPARFRPWAYAIVTNKCHDWIRRRAYRRVGAGREVDLQHAEHISESSAWLHNEADGRDDEIHALRAAMRALSPLHRAALALYYLDGMTVSEIADALTVPEGTVKSRLHHARERLRIIIERNERMTP